MPPSTVVPRPASGAAKLAQRQLLRRAVDLLRSRELDKAELIFNSILARWPDQADALHFLGVLAHQRGHGEAALEKIRQAIAISPGTPGPWNNLGNVLVEL